MLQMVLKFGNIDLAGFIIVPKLIVIGNVGDKLRANRE
jgi:hypothetical protein